MRTRLGIVLCALLLTLPVGGGAQAAHAATSGRQPGRMVLLPAQLAPAHCESGFLVTLSEGPDAGLVLLGQLTLDVDATGAASGQLSVGDPAAPQAAALAVVGQITGRAASLLFRQADGSSLYGVGVLERPIDQCSGAMGGPVVGPQPGDAGDWSAVTLACTPNLCCEGGVCMICQLIGSTNVCRKVQPSLLAE